MLENITQWLGGLGDMAREIIDTPQIILLAIIFLVGWLLQFLLRRLLHTLGQRLPEARWSSSLLLIARRLALLPFAGRALRSHATCRRSRGMPCYRLPDHEKHRGQRQRGYEDVACAKRDDARPRG